MYFIQVMLEIQGQLCLPEPDNSSGDYSFFYSTTFSGSEISYALMKTRHKNSCKGFFHMIKRCFSGICYVCDFLPYYSTEIDIESNISFSHSGIPETTPIHSVNRQCSSGLQACMTIAGEETGPYKNSNNIYFVFLRWKNLKQLTLSCILPCNHNHLKRLYNLVKRGNQMYNNHLKI